MNSHSDRSHLKNSKSKPVLNLNSLESPHGVDKIKAKHSNLFDKLNLMTERCEKVQKDVRKAAKVASQGLKKKLETFEDLNFSEDEDDQRWREELQAFKEKKAVKNSAVHKLKAMSLPELHVKEPIKRMKAKNELRIPERTRISASEIYSSVGKYILAHNKRNFGEIKGSKKEVGQRSKKKDLSNGGPGEIRKRSSININSKEFISLDRVKNLPKLSRQIKEVNKRRAL